ncbi:MAG: zinc/manganese transport system permease protein [Solirubrobacteraceae bacterium]|nr:zinc/manganese transport system permease protein [Solirubrobacteraceae bacterium]
MLSHEFVRNAYLAGSFIAVACGLVGYFVVLRSQVFAGDALSHVAFTGALAAAAIGIDTRVGLFAATVVVGVALGALGRRARADDVVIGSVFAWILGLGVLFLSIFASSAGGGNGATGVRVLFGSIFGLSPVDARFAAVIAAAVCVALLAMARPLLFITIDPEVARAQGVPMRLLGTAFLVLLAVTTAESAQAVGALLLLGLLAAPAGAAHQLTPRPYLGLLLSAMLTLASMWAGLGLSYAVATIPPSTAIITVAVAIYVLAAGARALISSSRSAPATVDASH